ncbi:DMT family transporter [Streptomyces zagrosensis]|uniref:Quaternary ammonium compound-resistance protein SugE n=1 Tax=Streptomyces zagrosensis TaxID=1042984 RepID=A0A7W9Q612_9ACTN|nr:multidrug efflux SMR transporter [Streptomyces zagrosensis]MBB5934044.1 quaternary ammonium compound-resistance protein SugE [Streptomyces zagrosensis]
MAWTYLFIAAVFEVAFALSTNATKGFTRLWPSITAVATTIVSVYFLSLSLKTLDVSVGYTIWTGLGSLGTVTFGALIYKERITMAKVISFMAIIGGVVGLKLSAGV